MPYLGDYLGQLISEITTARMNADLESIRIADFYSTHPYLKYLPVPHFRLPTVTLNVPVSIQEVEQPPPVTRTAERTAVRTKFDRLVELNLPKVGIRLDSDQMKALKKQVTEKCESLMPTAGAAPVSTTHIASELTNLTIQFLKGLPTKSGDSNATAQLSSNLQKAAQVEFLSIRTPPSRLNVGVTTADMSKVADKSLLATLQLSISEEAVEWSLEDTPGDTKGRLVPE